MISERQELMVQRPEDLRNSFKDKIAERRASLTDVEFAFLHALLIDDDNDDANNNNNNEISGTTDGDSDQNIQKAHRRLDDEMLFNVPLALVAENDNNGETTKDYPPNKRRPAKTKHPKKYRLLVGLWQAFEDGVSPKKLDRIHQSIRKGDDLTTPLLGGDDGNEESTCSKGEEGYDDDSRASYDDESIRSDVEVRGEALGTDDCSWDDNDGDFDHFDAWQVLKDEYAGDFGFDYSVDGGGFSWDDDELENSGFKIIGTSADDKSAHPHVLSPPLIDSIVAFIPDHLQGQNLWLKYSLIRDGASLDTFKQYARASKDTIIAIETTKGHVFGSYTSSSWRTNPSFYGEGPSFVWKMRYNRNTPCHSLFEQAEMEGEIDLFFLIENEQRPQCCTSHKVGIGQGIVKSDDLINNKNGDGDGDRETITDKDYGFAIALEDDLLSGTSSKCQSYTSPCLVDCDSNSEAFEVLNLELWTFTPCFEEEAAEKLEMTQFFISESIRNPSIASSTCSDGSSMFSSRDFDQKQFYRKVGHDDANEELRERWQYRNMMDGDLDNNSKGMSASPRFASAAGIR